jgi:hypothetical protein
MDRANGTVRTVRVLTNDGTPPRPGRRTGMLKRTLMLVLTLALAVPPAAPAASIYDIYDDCQDNGRLDGTYTQAEYRDALAGMAEDFKEYDSCDEQIQAAQAGLTSRNEPGAKGGTSPDAPAPPRDLPKGNGVGSIPLGPDGKPLDPEIDAVTEERASLAAARSGEELEPALAGVRVGDPDAELPVPLLVVLAVAALAAGAVGALKARQLLR